MDLSHLHPVAAAFIVWDAWLISWLIAAVWASRAAKRPMFGAGMVHWTVTVIGLAILFDGWRALPAMGYLPPPDVIAWAFVAVTVAGFVFAWWARLHLGTLWSGSVTLKQDHKVIDSGPYRLVRHPIYTGMILSAFATAAAIGSGTAVLGAVIMTIGLWVKARLEERFLRTELGEAYDAYRARTPMLIPFWR
jgi:protein-S-isoprenylcysteine O-methyltransferase Ste14